MTDAAMSEVTLLRPCVCPVLRFERNLPVSVEAAWRAITDPAKMRAWFPTRIHRDRRRPMEVRCPADAPLRRARRRPVARHRAGVGSPAPGPLHLGYRHDRLRACPRGPGDTTIFVLTEELSAMLRPATRPVGAASTDSSTARNARTGASPPHRPAPGPASCSATRTARLPGLAAPPPEPRRALPRAATARSPTGRRHSGNGPWTGRSLGCRKRNFAANPPRHYPPRPSWPHWETEGWCPLRHIPVIMCG